MLRVFVRGLCLNAFHSFVGGTDKAIKKIMFCANLLIKKLGRECAQSKDAVQAGA